MLHTADTPEPDTTGLLRAFIAEQPVATERAFAAAAALPTAGWPPEEAGLTLVGSGSSSNAITAARPAFTHGGTMATVMGPEDFLQEFPPTAPGKRAVIILSQSGNSRTSVAGARAALDGGAACLAITMNPDFEIAATGAQLLVLPIGPEPIGPKTKGFTASLAALLALAGAPPPPSGWLAPLIAPAREAAASLAPQLHQLDAIMVCGRGAQYGIALEASLKIAEIAGIPGAAFTWEEALHGRLHGLTARSLGIFIATTEADLAEAGNIAAAMQTRGVRLCVVNLTGEPGAWDWWLAAPPPPGFAPIAAVLPFQFLAAELAEARGLAPEKMRYAGLSADLDIKIGPAIGANQ